MSYIHYQKMAILDFWPVRSFQGNHHCIEILLTLSEHNNSFGIIVFPEDLNFYEYFDLNHETTQGIIQKVLKSDGQFIVKFFEKYAEELFNLVEGAIKGEGLKNYSDIKGNIELRSVDFLKWLPKKEYYVPSVLIEALDSGSVEEAEYLIEAFRQGFLYQFICERSGMTKRESREQLNENLKGFIESGGRIAQPPIPRSGPTKQETTESAPGYTFKRDGEFWGISFNGATHRFIRLKGFEYIFELIKRQGEKINALDLDAVVSPQSATPTVKENFYEDEDGNSESGLPVRKGLKSELPVFDPPEIRKMESHLKEANDALQEAIRENDIDRQNKSSTLIEYLEKQLDECKTSKGRLKHSDPAMDNARKSIQKNINSAIKKIREAKAEDLADHFKDSISTGRDISYNFGKPPVPWETN